MRTIGACSLILAATILVAAADAAACSFASPEPFAVDPAEAAIDAVAPQPPSAVWYALDEGDVLEQSSCFDLSTFTIAPTGASDDRTAAEDLGYQIELRRDVAEFVAAHALGLGADAAFAGPGVVFVEIDPDRTSLEVYDFDIRLRAIDRAGNLSEPTEWVRIVTPDESGEVHDDASQDSDEPACAAAVGAGGGSALLVLAALLPVRRRWRSSWWRPAIDGVNSRAGRR